MKAYVLIKVRVGEIREIIHQLQRIEAVKEASMTFGPYDAVVVVEANDLAHLGRVLANEIQPLPGILETLTCMAVET